MSSNGVSKSERPDEKVCNVEDCGAWKTGDLDFCHHHQGMASNGVPEEGNQRAQKHGLYSLPEHLRENFTETQEDRYNAYFEALCTRYKKRLGEEPDAFAKDRLSRVAIECVKERIADEYFAEQGEDNLLVESEYVQTDDGPVEVQQSNKLLRELTALKRETRMTLKDMGLLHDPDSEKGKGMQDLAAVIAENSDN